MRQRSVNFFVFVVCLAFIACKPVAKQPASDPFAVSDGKLALGVVPVEQNGTHGYRLLVCRYSSSYPKWKLESENHCLHALETEDGDEVVILQDELTRDFATKYEGYAKAGAVLTVTGIVLVGATAAFGIKAGKWVMDRPFVDAPVSFVTETYNALTRRISRFIPSRFKNRSLSTAGLVKEHATYKSILAQQKIKSTDRLVSARIEQARVVVAAHELDSLIAGKKFFENFNKLSPEDQAKRIDEIGKEITKITEKNPDMSAIKTDTLLKDIVTDIGDRAVVVGDGDEEIISNLATHHKFRRYRAISNSYKDGKLTGWEKIDDEIEIARKNLIDTKDDRTHSAIQGLPLPATQKVVRGAGAAAGVTYVALRSFDKSIWGYEDRQSSKYWSQIFHEDGSFGDTTTVQDVRGILESIAQTLGFKVNNAAVSL